MNRNKLVAAALLVILPFFLTACSLKDLPVIGKYLPEFPAKKSDFPTGEVTLSVWGLWEQPEVFDAVVKKYQEAHPNVKFNYEDRSVLKAVDYKDNVYSRLSQEGATVGDIIFVHNSWVPGLKDRLAPAPSKLLSTDSYTKRFYPAAAQSAIVGGNVYGAPLFHDGLVLVYNKKHFAAVNQTQPPATWEEFRRLALELSIRGQDGQLVRGGAAIGTFKNIDFASDILGLMFAQARVNVPNDLDSKPAYDALTFYTNFAKQDKVWSDSLPEASAAFSQEKVSMILVPTWNLIDILTSRPDWATSGNIGVAVVPQALLEEPATWASFWMGAVPASSANKAVAWDFLNFITEDAQQRIWFDEASKFRPFGPAYSSKSLKNELSSNAYLNPLLQQAETTSTGILAGRSGNKGSGEAIGKAINDILYAKNVNSEAALKTAKEALMKVH